MRNSSVLLLTLLFISLIMVPQSLSQTTQPKTLVVPDQYSTIQSAINNAGAGDTVLVKAGTYRYDEKNSIIARPHSGTPNYGIIVNKSISLIGENRNTILSIEWSQGSASAVCIQADDVTFSGFTIKSPSGSSLYSIGSVGILGSNCKIINNTFQPYVSGIGNNQNISYNTFEGSGLVFHFTNNTIANNKFSNGNGIDISDSSNVIIKGNYIKYVSRGICLRNTNQNVNTNISIYQNNITNNLRFGIELVGGTSNSSIFNNNIAHNGVGINLSNFALRNFTSIGSGTEIFYNNIWGNTKNVYIEKEYPYNLTSDMLHNKVIGNSTTVVSWDNGVVGNFWGDYNGNGSYVIDEKNVDNYPLIQQVDINSIAPTPTPTSTILSLVSDLTILAILIVVTLLAIIVFTLLFRRHRKTSHLASSYKIKSERKG